jgi:hypothetical protein
MVGQAVDMFLVLDGKEPIWRNDRNAGRNRVVARLRTDALMAPPLTYALTRSGMLVRDQAKEFLTPGSTPYGRAPLNMGTLRASITSVLDTRPVPLFATVGTNKPHAIYVHEGRRAGAKMPPIDAIAAWVSQKKLLNRGGKGKRLAPDSVRVRAVAFLIARSIARKGIPPKPFLKDALLASQSEIKAEIAHAARMIEAAWKA